MSVQTEISFDPPKSKRRYPCFLLEDVNQATPLIITLLSDGEIPLLGRFSAGIREIQRISPSAFNVEKLLKTHRDVKVLLSETREESLKSVEEYLEGIEEWMHL